VAAKKMQTRPLISEGVFPETAPSPAGIAPDRGRMK
jgi:hypothetical protein